MNLKRIIREELIKESGVEKVVDAYRDIMIRVQSARRQELVDAGATIDDIH